MALREILLAEFDHEMAATRRLLACVPDRALTWKPHDRARSMGELASHITEVTAWTAHILDAPAFDLDAAPPPTAAATSTALLLEAFADQTKRARALVDRTDSELTAMWSLKQGGQELFSLPRAAAFRTFVLGHVVHHRGQLSVYLRMNDVPVPSIYGPSGDAIKRSG
jgi:uncharacterized damage-inducible protein DinB